MSTGHKEKIISLQVLRGIAVLLVMLAHAIDYSSNFGKALLPSFYSFENFGAIGVDLFFVISGAIMTVIASKNVTTPAKYLFRRCIRIIPLYWMVSVFCVLLSLEHLWPPIQSTEVLQTIVLIPFFSSGYHAGHILFLGWTLSFEFYFYIVMAIAMALNKNNPLPIVFTILLSLIGIGFILPAKADPRLHFFCNPIILEFLLGYVCGYLYTSKFTLNKLFVYSMFFAGILLIIHSAVSGFGLISEMQFTWDGTLSLKRVIQWGIPSFFLVAGSMLLEKQQLQFRNKSVMLVAGNISYAAYLTHIFSLMVVTAAWNHAGFKMPDVFILVALPFCFFIAYIIYWFVEKPITRYLNTKAEKYWKK